MALLEFESIAIGIEAGDAMVKRAPVAHIYSGTVQPGHYLVMVAGDVASVEEAVDASRRGREVERICFGMVARRCHRKLKAHATLQRDRLFFFHDVARELIEAEFEFRHVVVDAWKEDDE